MVDFLTISTRSAKGGSIEIAPKFIIKRSKDLMIRGSDFYAIWLEDRGLWSTDEDDVCELIDRELDTYLKEYQQKFNATPKVLYMRDAESGMIDRWHRYCQSQMRDNFEMLDKKLIFSNMEPNKKDYASKRLPYPLEEGECPAFQKLISTLYNEEERHKIEWAIGSIVTGDSKWIQKFVVLYGDAGTGKSTILNIIQKLFEGYYTVFDAKALGSASNSFALEAFKTNPLVAIQHDGDLSRIEDNTRLNSIVSHEEMTINEKFKSTYVNRFECFLFMGTNRPVKITDAKSGLIRRLIDVTPSGKKLTQREYRETVKQIDFELGAIASYCKEVYLADPGRYDDYIPTLMMGASNDFYNFVVDSYSVFLREDKTTLKAAYEMYSVYCDEAKVQYPMSRRTFREELRNYFWDFDAIVELEDGSMLRDQYSRFRTDKFDTGEKKQKKQDSVKPKLLELNCTESIFDRECAQCPAQYATKNDIPTASWDEVTTVLDDLDTTEVHFVRVPENHIVIDFDIPDESGGKNLERNLEEAAKWPPTYAELSKSGKGVHLHYIYTGDVSKLDSLYDDHIEIKVFTGKSSLRRRLTKCNGLPIATINSGLPLKEEKKVINFDGLKNEKALRTVIKRNLNREYHPNTRCCVDFIYKALEDAYSSGMKYDVSDLQNAVYVFAGNSTNQADYCLKLTNKMKFRSDDPSEYVPNEEAPIVFYDVEVFPNLFLVNWKFQGEDKPVVRMINPKPHEIEQLIKYRLIGFNNRRYDNHMLYARMIGYSNEQLYELSRKIVKTKKGENNRYLFSEAYNLSYTDIYDFASASNKQSLKKFEIQLGIHHQELGLPWDQPVPEERWVEVAEYCDNDVIASEAVFNHLKGDWLARQILADVSGMSVNDTTNSLSQRIIFGTNRKPQSEFNYRNLAEPVSGDRYEEYRRKFGPEYKFRVFDETGVPLYRDYIPGETLPEGYSILPFFPGYKFEGGKSTYLGEDIGEGGKVYGEPGIYWFVWDADVTGQHPSSILAEVLFGPRYTKAFRDIVYGRVSIKHEAWDQIDDLFGGKLKPYIQKVINGELRSKDLANALKTVVNSVYGQTAASYENPFRDIRNKDNIVAKRGALFMTLLKHEVQRLGYTVCHIKTDSIKIPNADDFIREFVLKFGKEFGYEFETEAEFERFCLVNNAVYIAKEVGGGWTATGEQFKVPYVFKTLFSKEQLVFEDFCETFEVKTALYLDMNEGLPDGEHDYRFVGKVGSFCPIKPGHGGGVLFRQNTDKEGNVKYDSATGADGYRWLESEMVRTLGEVDDIDISFYEELARAAVYGKGKGAQYKPGISDFGDFEQFVNGAPPVSPWFAADNPNEVPWRMACGKDTCYGCSELTRDGCKAGHDNSDYLATFDEEETNFKRR